MRSINERVTPWEPEDAPARIRLVEAGPWASAALGLAVGEGVEGAGAGGSRLRRRASAEEVLSRAHLLEATDRRVIEAIYGSGRTAAEVARVLGLPARKVSGRVRGVVKRLCSRECTLVQSMKSRWPETRRAVAVACFVHGLSIRRASERLGISFHSARQHYAAVRAILEAAP